MTGIKAVLGSPLQGYWGSDNSQHVNFIGVDNHVHELYIAPGAGWVDNDLTALARGVAPMHGTALAGYWGSDNSVHVNFIGVDNHVHQLYIAPGSGWVDNDLTALTGGAAAALVSALDGYWGSDSSQHVNFIGTDNHVHELYIAPGRGWVNNDLTALAAAVPPTVDAPPPIMDGYWGSDSSQHVDFIGTDGHLHELFIAPGAAGWVDHDLTVLAAAVGPLWRGLDGYWGSDSSQHVNFIGTDGHVHELFIAPGAAGWVDHDLSKLAAAVPLLGGTALNGYWGSDSSQHVNFIGSTDGHVHELYIAPPGAAGWVDHDLTKLGAAVAPKGGTALDGYWGSDSSQHVNFIGVDDHVHELYAVPGAGWVDNDLTALA